MSEMESRYACPVCLGVTMEKLNASGEGALLLDVCRRCGGIWFDYGEVGRLRRMHSKALGSEVVLNPQTPRMRCRSCGLLMDRNAPTCSHCGWRNRIDCPTCLKTMKVTRLQDLVLDYCTACKGVWFDNIELSEIWNGKLDSTADACLRKRGKSFGSAGEASEFFIDVLAYEPGLVVYGSQAAVEMGKVSVEAASTMISHAPEVSGAAVEASGELAGAVFECISEIIAGLFSGF